MRTLRSRADKPAAGAAGTDCAVCTDKSQRVAVVCAACRRSFHLSCLSPPLRRRPALAHAWQCPDCKEQDGASRASARAQRKRSVAQTRSRDGKTQEPPEETAAAAAKTSNSSGQEEETAPKKRRLSKRAAARLGADAASESASGVRDPDCDDLEDAPIAPTRAKRSTGKAALKKKKAPAAAPALTRRSGRTSRRAASATVSRYNLSENEEEDGEDDNDSDFVGETASEEEEEDGAISDQDASDEALVQPIRRRSAKTKTRTKRPPATKAKRRASPQPAARPPPARDTVNTNGVVSDADSLDIVVEGADEESSDEEEIYEGPHYYIEYAVNGRAKCKSCEQKLPLGIVRVGVRIRHSIFGITTYFKHLECTHIGLAASDKGESESNGSAETKSSEPIEGLSSLEAPDQKRVREYMANNDLEGVMDERLELADNHFNKKEHLPEKEPSCHLTATLLPYQREALGWMVAQEESDYKGGILADEMGMGKTIQAISLILENIRLPDQPAKKKNPKASNPPILRGGTLVVCPLVAVMQWKSEIERFVERDHLSIYIHHGPKRVDLPSRIASYDIVLTTYSIVESEIRKTLGWAKVACKYCGKKYLPDKLISHNKYFCGPNAKKTALQNKQDTKKRRKKAAGESSEEDDYPKKPAPKSKRKPSPRATKNDDDDDDGEASPQPKKTKGKSPLHQIQWTRIVLDEAHYIKDRNCNTARGVFALKSDYKWCLTGTPLQNRIGELFSLVRFLQVRKFAFYHCTMCDCQMLDYNFPDRKCAQCSHAATQHFSYFNKKIVIPIQSYGYVAEGKLAMQRLQNQVLQHILLRRTKEGRADDISLPPKLVRVRKDRLDERENDFYEAIYTQSQAQFNTYVSSGTLLNNYAHIFDLLIRLRQAVDHPYLVIYSKSNPALQLPRSSSSPAANLVEQQPFLSNDGDNVDDERLCTICHEGAEDVVVAKCSHDFCRECVKEFIESLPVGAEAMCPACSKPLTVDLSPKTDTEVIDTSVHPSTGSPKAVDLSKFRRHSILHRISDVHAFQSSTKIEALMQELELMKARDPSGKAIIFSQFVNMLDLIQHRLELGGVKCVKMSGSMSMLARDTTIKAFRDDPTVTAFLISLKAGGVALNLTVASHIFLMDPWWNPAAENQAIDRTHRLGQFKPIQATRFIIAGTVEERILKLQEKKRLIFEGTVGANVSAICRLTEEDLRFLFAT